MPTVNLSGCTLLRIWTFCNLNIYFQDICIVNNLNQRDVLPFSPAPTWSTTRSTTRPPPSTSTCAENRGPRWTPATRGSRTTPRWRSISGTVRQEPWFIAPPSHRPSPALGPGSLEEQSSWWPLVMCGSTGSLGSTGTRINRSAAWL